MSEKFRFENERELKLGHIKGDVDIKNCSIIIPEKGDEIVIEGALRVRGDTVIQGSLRAEYLEIDGRNTSEIHGNLTVARSVHVGRGKLEIEGSASANKFDVGAALSVGKDLQATKVSVGGALSVKGNATVDDLNVGGAVKIGERIDAKTLRVGGAARCNSGIIGKVDVGGSFKAEGAIEIGSIDVGGAVVVGPDSKVLSIDVGGSFKSTGDLTFEELDVGGAAKFTGNATGKSVDVGGAVKAEQSLTLSEKLDVGGAIAVNTDLVVGEEIDVGGSLRAGRKVESPIVRVGGSIKAIHIKADKEFSIGRRGEVSGFVQAHEITVEEKARGDSFYGDSIRVEEQARVKNLYGREIYIERNATIEGEVQYTEKLEVEPGVNFRQEPAQVKQLPNPENLLK